MHSSEVGTFPYAAPEIDKRIYGEKVDILSLGVTFFELLTGISNDLALKAAIERFRSNEFPEDCVNEFEEEVNIEIISNLVCKEDIYLNCFFFQFDLFKQMVSKDPGVRPTIDNVEKQISKWIKEEMSKVKLR